jgi:hypothetical protein
MTGKLTENDMCSEKIYIPFTVGTVDLGPGVIKLFKGSEQKEDYVPISICSGLESNVEKFEYGTIVLIPSVPSYMTPADLLDFMGDTAETVLQFRNLRDASAERYMTLLRFDNRSNAARFYDRCNLKKFNSLSVSL